MTRRPASRPGPYLLHLELLRERVDSFDRFPYVLPAVRHLERLAFHPRVTFFVGENGSGKSTLLEAIAVASGLNAEGGSRHFGFETQASHSDLHEALRLAKSLSSPRDRYFLRAETFYNVASEIERLGVGDAYGEQSLHAQSHGESFFALFRHRFGDHGLYLLDEPEAALSPARQLEFLVLLHDYVRRGGQFVIATHSPILMAYPDAAIVVFDEDGLHETSYAETEHFRVMRRFMSDPRRAVDALIADQE